MIKYLAFNNNINILRRKIIQMLLYEDLIIQIAEFNEYACFRQWKLRGNWY